MDSAVLAGTTYWKTAAQTDCAPQAGPTKEIYDIFEGTEQIQELVISRAISGLRIE